MRTPKNYNDKNRFRKSNNTKINYHKNINDIMQLNSRSNKKKKKNFDLKNLNNYKITMDSPVKTMKNINPKLNKYKYFYSNYLFLV